MSFEEEPNDAPGTLATRGEIDSAFIVVNKRIDELIQKIGEIERLIRK